MYIQLLILAVAVPTACGMCFGVPLFDQAMVCPAPTVYYAPLCVCMHPHHVGGMYEKSPVRQVPVLEKTWSSPQAYKNTVRSRLSASLPDMAAFRYGSSVAESRPSMSIFPGHFLNPHSQPTPNHIPRSWRIGGLREGWSRDAFVRNEVPSVDSAVKAYTAANPNDIATLTLMERLSLLRNARRQQALVRARSRQAVDPTLSQRFYSNLPSTIISPDMPGSNARALAGTVESGPDVMTKEKQMPPINPKKAPKVTPLADSSFVQIQPKNSRRRMNSFQRSAMRLKAARLAG